MRLILDVQRSETGWSVRALDPATRQDANGPTGQPLLPVPRELRVVATDAGRFPLPPPVDCPPPGDDLERLCNGSPAVFTQYFEALLTQSIDLERTRTFGKYLFRTLIGPSLWQDIVSRIAAVNEGLELIVSWSTDQSELTRLPWEILHAEQDFLVAGKGFSLAREVAGARAALRPINTPPRVLFVIGSGGEDRHFDGLKPGAEYFGLLRGLRQNSTALNTIPLVGATSKRLEMAIEHWRPDVVHFICHGREDGTLDLVDDDNPDSRKSINATQLYRLLNPNSTDPNTGNGGAGPAGTTNPSTQIGGTAPAGTTNPSAQIGGAGPAATTNPSAQNGGAAPAATPNPSAQNGGTAPAATPNPSTQNSGTAPAATTNTSTPGGGALSADDLYPGPQIVVLNACHSASASTAGQSIEMQNAGQPHFPLAAALVLAGVPVVVGMAGEVADQACRLFTRGFYQSLLTDGRVACAAAKGRRAGLLHGNHDGQRIDWALPTLFVSQGASSTEVVVRPDSHQADWHELARALDPPPFPAYYARLDLLRLFGLLMLDDTEQRKLENRSTGLQVLGLSSAERDTDRFGRTCALMDLSAAAARSGDVPIVIEKRFSGRWPPVEVKEFLALLIRSSRATLENLGLDSAAPAFSWRATGLILNLAPGTRPPPESPPEVLKIFSGGDARAEYHDMLAAAARYDALSYLDAVRTQRQRPRAKLLLLIDDLHKMGEAVPFVLNHLLSTEGLRSSSARKSIRVLFTHARSGSNEQAFATTPITDFLSQQSYATDITLANFREPTESQLAYQNYLFNWYDGTTAKSLVPVRTHPTDADVLYRALGKQIRGVPSMLANEKIKAIVDAFLDVQKVREATDEDALRRTS